MIWVPFETESVTFSSTPADEKATCRVVGGDALEAGKANPVQVICTAENGEEKIYTVQVQRAAAHGEKEEPPVTEPEPSEPTAPTQPTETQPDTQPSTPADTRPTETQPELPPEPADPVPQDRVPLWYLIPVGAGGIALGLAIGLIAKKKKIIYMEKPDD